MDDQRYAAAMTDVAVGDELAQDIARALAVDPSPDFQARVRMRIASEPVPGMWRRASALRSSWFAASLVVAAAMVVAIVVIRPNRAGTVPVKPPLAARAIAGDISIPHVGSRFERPSNGGSAALAFRQAAAGPAEAVHDRPLAAADPAPLLDPREMQALRSLLASVRNNRVDLSPLLTTTAPTPTGTSPASDLVITPIAIEPIAPTAGAQDPISSDSASSGQGERQ